GVGPRAARVRRVRAGRGRRPERRGDERLRHDGRGDVDPARHPRGRARGRRLVRLHLRDQPGLREGLRRGLVRGDDSLVAPGDPPRTGWRGAGIFGVVAGGAAATLVLTRTLPLNVHGFGMIVLLQSAWTIWMAARLSRDESIPITLDAA